MSVLWFCVVVLAALGLTLFVFLCWGAYYGLRVLRVKEALKQSWLTPSGNLFIAEDIAFQDVLPTPHTSSDTEQCLNTAFDRDVALYVADVVYRIHLTAHYYKQGYSATVRHREDVEPVHEFLVPQALHHPPSGYVYRVPSTDTRVGGPLFVAAFRGTSTSLEVDQDFRMSQIPFYDQTHKEPHGHVHQGFYEWYQNVSQSFWSQTLSCDTHTTWYVSGFSLGATLALFLGVDLAYRFPDAWVYVYTLASPRVGDPEFASFAQQLPNLKIWNIGNRSDLIRDVPPTITPNILKRKGPLAFVYQHIGSHWEFQCLQKTLQENHHLSTYIKALQDTKNTPGYFID